MSEERPAPYLRGVALRDDASVDPEKFPFSLSFVRSLDLELTRSVTFLVGENGSGKSTLVEAIAQLSGLPVGGGGRNDLADSLSPHLQSELAPALRASFARRPKSGYFFRAEFQAHFASVLEVRRDDPDFLGDPFARYGGQSLHTRSHGEAFLAMFSTWLSPGLILMDEPEAALSPQRQLNLLAQMAAVERQGNAQFIIATHSPLLPTFPGASIISFDGSTLEPVRLEDTTHYRITRSMLESPERYWRHLVPPDDGVDAE